MTKHKFVVLDGIRGIAALYVMIYHYTWDVHYAVFNNASIAVDLFFILSGFVIAYSYSARLLNGMTLSEFMSRRFIRLYPMFIVGIVMGAISLSLLKISGGVRTHGEI